MLIERQELSDAQRELLKKLPMASHQWKKLDPDLVKAVTSGTRPYAVISQFGKELTRTVEGGKLLGGKYLEAIDHGLADWYRSDRFGGRVVMPLSEKLAIQVGHAELPEDPWRYFNKVSGTILVPLSKLKPIRARPTGIEHANKYMRMAYDGAGKKRDPISLKQEPDGTYSIQDGNSTYANAVANKWKSIPAAVVA